MSLRVDAKKTMATLCALGATSFALSGGDAHDPATNDFLDNPVLTKLAGVSGAQAATKDKPNIVLIFLDNFGWGEPGFNGGGITRGT